MKILGLDPGETSGWCIYDTDTRRVLGCGEFPSHLLPLDVGDEFDVAVIERPRGYGPTFPQVVECGYVCGRMVQMFTSSDDRCEEMLRYDICRILTDTVHGVVRVKNDATAWAALKLIHGDGCHRKDGPLHKVSGHARAALAVAVAYGISVATAPRAL